MPKRIHRRRRFKRIFFHRHGLRRGHHVLFISRHSRLHESAHGICHRRHVRRRARRRRPACRRCRLLRKRTARHHQHCHPRHQQTHAHFHCHSPLFQKGTAKNTPRRVARKDSSVSSRSARPSPHKDRLGYPTPSKNIPCIHAASQSQTSSPNLRARFCPSHRPLPFPSHE